MRLALILWLSIVCLQEGYAVKNIEFLSNNHKTSLQLQNYRGKVIVIVNTASKCGFAKQYPELEELWKKYKDEGLVIIAVPSNDFLSQEPGSDEEIQQFCQVNFGVTFPIAAKVNVTGQERHPFFDEVQSTLGKSALPKWNFYKYIIARDGSLVNWFSSFTSPLSSKFIRAIEKELVQGNNSEA